METDNDYIEEDKWKQDISKLKNYKIIDSKFDNPYIKNFVDCIFRSSKNIKDVRACGHKLPSYVEVEAGGDMRCSGKSEILHLMFPDLHKEVKFSQEEERGRIKSIIDHFSNNLDESLSIYVKRNPEEKLKCLLKHRGIFNKDINRKPEYYDRLPNDLKNEAYSELETMRQTLLPEIYKHENYIIVENTNKEEEPYITNDKICRIISKQLDQYITDLKENLELDIQFKKRFNKNPNKTNVEYRTKKASEIVNYINEYIDICNPKQHANLDTLKKLIVDTAKFNEL